MDGACLVILGDAAEGSTTQQRHNDLFELVITPAVERLGLDLQRQQGVPAGESLQDAAVCIVDVSGIDAAVAFQCGRRHEASRPVIQLVPDDDGRFVRLPVIHSVVYDLESPRGVHEARRQIERHLDDAQTASRRAGLDLETLTRAIERIDIKLDALLDRERYPDAELEPVGEHTLEDLMRSPQEAFLAAVGNGRMDEAARHLVQMRRTGGIRTELVAAAALVATSGHEEGAKILEELLTDHRAELDSVEFNSAVGAYIRYHLRADREGEALAKIGALLDVWLADPELTVTDRAYLHNQAQMLYWGVNDVAAAEDHARRAIALNPEQPSYKYNLSMLLEDRGELEEAETLVDAYMTTEQSQDDSDHLSQAVDIYLKRDRPDDARAAYERLKQVDRGAAQVKRMLNPDVDRLLGA
jgi:tetratricopeptide (TPR) repeat protein